MMTKIIFFYNLRKMETLISNIVLNLETNLNINLIKFVSLYGGNFSRNLPAAARRIIYIRDLRYSFLIHSTGSILLSNFHISFNQSNLFSWIFSLLTSMVENNVAKIKDGSQKLKIKLLVENFCCASHIDICKRFEQIKTIRNLNLSIQESIRLQKQLNYDLLDKFLANLNEIENLVSIKNLKRKKFPAKIIKIQLKRDWLQLINHKSLASKKRKRALAKITTNTIENLYQTQNCTISFFLNGKLLVTGSQTKQDLSNIMNIFYILFNSIFFNN